MLQALGHTVVHLIFICTALPTRAVSMVQCHKELYKMSSCFCFSVFLSVSLSLSAPLTLLRVAEHSFEKTLDVTHMSLFSF